MSYLTHRKLAEAAVRTDLVVRLSQWIEVTRKLVVGFRHAPGCLAICDSTLGPDVGTGVFGLRLGEMLCLDQTAAGEPPAWKHAAFLLAWPGMDAAAFLDGRRADRPTASEWCLALGMMVIGVLMLAAVCPLMGEGDGILFGWIGMLGIVFVLHFGAFHLLACVWRACGLRAAPIMNWPIAARSLTDFWGRRWNLAFHELANRFCFRPLLRSLGPAGALFASFVASGLVHDLIISVPAGGGYGLPTAYFTLQGAGILAQRSRLGARLGLGGGVRGWLVTWRCWCCHARCCFMPGSCVA